MTTPDYPFHPVANLFPMLADDEIRDLRDDIAKHGQREPILRLMDGRILDGRNRYVACSALGLEPTYKEIDLPDEADALVPVVVSLNLIRRHLSTSQRALIGERVKVMFEEDARRRQEATRAKPGEKVGANLPAPSGDNGRSRDHAADLLKVSPRSVEHASKVIERGVPELVAAVDSGEVTVSAASELTALPDAEIKAALAEGPAKVKEIARERREERKQASAEDRQQERDGRNRLEFADAPLAVRSFIRGAASPEERAHFTDLATTLLRVTDALESLNTISQRHPNLTGVLREYAEHSRPEAAYVYHDRVFAVLFNVIEFLTRTEDERA